MDLTRCKTIDISNDKPAIDGGKPMFREKLNIIRPTLFDLAEMMEEIREIFLFKGWLRHSCCLSRLQPL